MNKITYGRQLINSRDIKVVEDVLKSDWITQGPKVASFERSLCGYTGAKYAVAVSSGTAALHLAVLAAGIGKGDEVITSPITFVASANCVAFCGAKPVFADIEQDTVNISPEEIEKKITKKTKALIPVHFAGQPCDIERIRKIARRSNLFVIEDACHALGSRYKSTKIGDCKYSDMTVFSFHPLKSITTGEGGAILTNNKRLYGRMLLLRNHGITRDRKRISSYHGPWYYQMLELGFNYRISDIQCALGISQLKRIDKFIAKRKEIVAVYNQHLSQVKEIELPEEKPWADSAWHIYYIKVKDPSIRKKLFMGLRKYNIYAQVHYIPVHTQEFYRQSFGYKEGDYKIAEDYYKRTITLPLHAGMKLKDAVYVVKVVKELISK